MNVPRAENFERNVLVLSTDGTDRRRLRWGAAGLALVLFGLGFGVGWIVRRRRTRNPRRKRRR